MGWERFTGCTGSWKSWGGGVLPRAATNVGRSNPPEQLRGCETFPAALAGLLKRRKVWNRAGAGALRVVAKVLDAEFEIKSQQTVSLLNLLFLWASKQFVPLHPSFDRLIVFWALRTFTFMLVLVLFALEVTRTRVTSQRSC